MKQSLRTATAASAVVGNLALVTAALVHRRPVFESTMLTAGLDVDPAHVGLAVNTALAVVVLGTALVYLLVRSLGRVLDRLVERRTGEPSQLARRVVDLTTAALQVSALLLPPDSGVRTAAALPLAVLLALPVVVWLLHRWVRRDLRTALSTLSLAVGATLATGVAFGRWF